MTTGQAHLDNFAENFRRAQAIADRLHTAASQSGGEPVLLPASFEPLIELGKLYAQLAAIGQNTSGIQRVQIINDGTE